MLILCSRIDTNCQQDGLKGCGKHIAAGLARTSLGDDLQEAFCRLSPADFVIFCVMWRQRLACEL